MDQAMPARRDGERTSSGLCVSGLSSLYVTFSPDFHLGSLAGAEAPALMTAERENGRCASAAGGEARRAGGDMTTAEVEMRVRVRAQTVRRSSGLRERANMARER